MKSEYKRDNLKITEFDAEDVITTSGLPDGSNKTDEIDNTIKTIQSFGKHSSWFLARVLTALLKIRLSAPVAGKRLC